MTVNIRIYIILIYIFRATIMLVCNMHPTVSVEMNMTSMVKLTIAIWNAKEIRLNHVVEPGQIKSTELVRCFGFQKYNESNL